MGTLAGLLCGFRGLDGCGPFRPHLHGPLVLTHPWTGESPSQLWLLFGVGPAHFQGVLPGCFGVSCPQASQRPSCFLRFLGSGGCYQAGLVMFRVCPQLFVFVICGDRVLLQMLSGGFWFLYLAALSPLVGFQEIQNHAPEPPYLCVLSEI